MRSVFSLEFLMEGVDALTALSFYFRPTRFVSANASSAGPLDSSI